MHALPPVRTEAAPPPEHGFAVPAAFVPNWQAEVGQTAPFPFPHTLLSVLCTAPLPSLHLPWSVPPVVHDQPLALAAEPDTQAHVPGPLTLFNTGLEYLNVFFAIN